MCNSLLRFGKKKPSTLRRPAPHELQFLRSVSQSLGMHPPTVNGRAAEVSFCRYRGRILPRGHFSNSTDRHPRATSDDRTASHPLPSLSDRRLSTDTSEIPTSLSSPISVSILPFLSTSDIQTPAMPSSAQYMVSCKNLNSAKSAQPGVISNPSHTSSRHQCKWEVAENQPCGEWIEGGSKEVWIHVRTAHGLKGLYNGWCHCGWVGCLEKLKVSSLQRHLAKHLVIKWRCSSCDIVFSRDDYVRKHIKLTKECHGAEAVIHLVSEQTSGTSIGKAGVGIAETSLTGGLVSTGEHHFTNPWHDVEVALNSIRAGRYLVASAIDVP